MKFPLSYQSGKVDCGPACLKMIAAFYDQHYELEFLKKKCRVKKKGVSMHDLFRVGRAIGFHCTGVKMTIDHLKEIVRRAPVILHFNKNHFVVVYKAPKPERDGVYHIADPANGLIKVNEIEFAKYWIGNMSKQNRYSKGYALLVEPAS